MRTLPVGRTFVRGHEVAGWLGGAALWRWRLGRRWSGRRRGGSRCRRRSRRWAFGGGRRRLGGGLWWTRYGGGLAGDLGRGAVRWRSILLNQRGGGSQFLGWCLRGGGGGARFFRLFGGCTGRGLLAPARGAWLSGRRIQREFGRLRGGCCLFGSWHGENDWWVGALPGLGLGSYDMATAWSVGRGDLFKPARSRNPGAYEGQERPRRPTLQGQFLVSMGCQASGMSSGQGVETGSSWSVTGSSGTGGLATLVT